MRGSPLAAGRLVYGWSMAAVCDSMTPSAISLIAPALNTGSSAYFVLQLVECVELLGRDAGVADSAAYTRRSSALARRSSS